MRFPDFANMGFAFLNGINTSSDRRSKDTLKVITTDIFRFPGNPSHEYTRSERAVCEKLQSFHILKLQVYQREKMNKHSAKSQNTQHSISTANKKKSFTITTVSFFNKMDFADLKASTVQRGKSGQFIQKWTILGRTRRSFEPEWTIIGRSGPSFD